MVVCRARWTVCVPFVGGMLREETRAAVLDQDANAVFVELPRTSPTAYARLLLDLWRRPGDVVIVEQDVIPPPYAIANLLRCTSGWCTHPMLHGEKVATDLLGLAKFSDALKRLCPQAGEAALLGGIGAYMWPHWRSCDQLLSRWFRHRDYDPCVHLPQAVHLKYPAPPPMQENPRRLPPPGVPSDGSFQAGDQT